MYAHTGMRAGSIVLGGKHSESELAPESMGNALIGIHRQAAVRSAWNY